MATIFMTLVAIGIIIGICSGAIASIISKRAMESGNDGVIDRKQKVAVGFCVFGIALSMLAATLIAFV